MNILTEIEKVRLSCNFSKADMARLLGVSKSCIYYWEKGERKPHFSAKQWVYVLKNYHKKNNCMFLLEKEIEKGKPIKELLDIFGLEVLGSLALHNLFRTK